MTLEKHLEVLTVRGRKLVDSPVEKVRAYRQKSIEDELQVDKFVRSLKDNSSIDSVNKNVSFEAELNDSFERNT